jgi:predicted amidohydrolase YtcJ
VDRKILAVGSTDAMLRLAVPGARIVELNGRRVLPGFNDAHVHVTGEARNWWACI